MNNEFGLNKILKGILWVSSIGLLWTSIMDFGTMAVGINTYLMYFLLSVLMIYILFKSRTDKVILVTMPIICLIYFFTEIFNWIYYSFYPSTHFFIVYTLIFVTCFVVSIIHLKKKAVRLSVDGMKMYLILIVAILSVVAGYTIQWMT